MRSPRHRGSGGARPVILVVDNYDSFTWNLVQGLRELGARVHVRRNDACQAGEIRRAPPDGILISPGPGRPEGAGVTEELIRQLGGRVPILGVCLGHQAIGRVAGARIVRAPEPMHGKSSPILHDGKGLFQGLASPFPATRYHSLVVEASSVPASLEISATSPEGLVMGLRARGAGRAPLEGVQFHPESILTPAGLSLLSAFLGLAAGWWDSQRSGGGKAGRSIIPPPGRDPGGCEGATRAAAGEGSGR